MPINKLIISCILLLYSPFTFSQDKCLTQEENCLTNIIQQNFITQEYHYLNNQSEYFILDIKLNEKADSLIEINYLSKKGSFHSAKIDSICKVIKQKWNPIGCIANRFIIPIFILFTSADKIYDQPIEFILNKDVGKSKIYTHLLKTIIINIQPRIIKQTGN
jgi:hypothetical protein